jgi:hypothetical protein
MDNDTPPPSAPAVYRPDFDAGGFGQTPFLPGLNSNHNHMDPHNNPLLDDNAKITTPQPVSKPNIDHQNVRHEDEVENLGFGNSGLKKEKVVTGQKTVPNGNQEVGTKGDSKSDSAKQGDFGWLLTL